MAHLNTILVIAFFLVARPGLTQSTAYGNFKIDEQQLIYQKIFVSDSATVAKLRDFYQSLPYVANVAGQGDEISFDLNDLVVDYKKFQFTQVATPSIIQTGKYSGKVMVGVKDGRYRVTVADIVMTGDIGYKKITAKESLTSFACKNNGTVMAQDWCRPNMLGLLDQAFTDKLQFIERAKKVKDDNDW